MSFGLTDECNGPGILWNTKGVDAARVEVDAERVVLSADKYKGTGGLHFRSGEQGKGLNVPAKKEKPTVKSTDDQCFSKGSKKKSVKSTVETAMTKGTEKKFFGQVCYVKAQPPATPLWHSPETSPRSPVSSAPLPWIRCLRLGASSGSCQSQSFRSFLVWLCSESGTRRNLEFASECGVSFI